jgi:hypothetical protein
MTEREVNDYWPTLLDLFHIKTQLKRAKYDRDPTVDKYQIENLMKIRDTIKASVFAVLEEQHRLNCHRLQEEKEYLDNCNNPSTYFYSTIFPSSVSSSTTENQDDGHGVDDSCHIICSKYEERIASAYESTTKQCSENALKEGIRLHAELVNNEALFSVKKKLTVDESRCDEAYTCSSPAITTTEQRKTTVAARSA